MSSIRLDPRKAIRSGMVNGWNGISTPESRIRWGELRFIASKCKDDTGIDSASASWRQHMASTEGKEHNYHGFLVATWDLVYRFVQEELNAEKKHLLSSMTKFPFGIHRCYADAGVLCPGYVSDNKHRYQSQRFLNLTGWMNFVSPHFTPSDMSDISSLQDCSLETLLGCKIGCNAFDVLNGNNGLRGCQNTKIQTLVLVGLVYDRLLEKPLYRDVLGLHFGNPPK